ncbi:MAG: glycosyltransferase [Kiritimatiellia bacterium]|jgi:glycosyltransferase involved in cell wall biosynthesis
MNILIALYTRRDSNSGFHVTSLAHELAAFGHDCVIAVPVIKTQLDDGEPFRTLTFADVQTACAEKHLFQNGRGIDVFHAWTPRTTVTEFHASIQRFITGGTFVHLEDNEDEIARAFLGDRVFARTLAGGGSVSFPSALSHPVHSRAFLSAAKGVTVIIDALADRVPDGMPTCRIWPAADDGVFFPRAKPEALRERLGIPPGTTVLVYTGNGHPANVGEIRSLYLAVHLLNRVGMPTRIVRTGHDSFPCPADYREWADQYAVNLGFVQDRRELGELLALADVCVQPGRPGPFNDFRFPSKLPEFFASARPVVLPRTNIGLVVRHREEAYVLDNADGAAIADAVRTIVNDPELAETLARGGRAFYEANLSWHRSAKALETFYQTCL